MNTTYYIMLTKGECEEGESDVTEEVQKIILDLVNNRNLLSDGKIDNEVFKKLKVHMNREMSNDSDVECWECGSSNLDFSTEKEWQGCMEHGGSVDVLTGYSCNHCGYRENL